MRYATCWVFFTTHALFLLWEFVLAQSFTWSRSIWHCGTGAAMHSNRRVAHLTEEQPLLAGALMDIDWYPPNSLFSTPGYERKLDNSGKH
jgi:hypothetical protein